MGKRIDAQHNPSQPYVQGIMEFTELATYRASHPWTWSDFIYENFSSMGKRFRQSLDAMHRFTKEVSLLQKAIFDKDASDYRR